MNDSPNEPLPNNLMPNADATSSITRTAAGLCLTLISVGGMVGTNIGYFYLKADHAQPFPYAWKLVFLWGMLASLALAIWAAHLVGPRLLLCGGALILVFGIGMLIFGFFKMSEPSLRFFAPLGFFVSLAGGFLSWVGTQLPGIVEECLQEQEEIEADQRGGRSAPIGK